MCFSLPTVTEYPEAIIFPKGPGEAVQRVAKCTVRSQRMDCDEVRRMLDAYLDGELDLTRQLDVVCPVVPPVKTRLKT
jgi:hypothetical protein